MTAAERLLQLAGATGTAAVLLLSIGTGATAGDALVEYSGLESATASEHLLADVAVPVAQGNGKHLFKQAYGCTTSEVKAECSSACRVAFPDVYRISIPADAPALSIHVATHGNVLDPFVGTVTVQVGEDCGSAFRVVKPRCAGRSPYSVRADQYSLWNVTPPYTGCGTSMAYGRLSCFGYTLVPKTIQNPSDAMLLAVFS
jgi:hypothetical protein